MKRAMAVPPFLIALEIQAILSRDFGFSYTLNDQDLSQLRVKIVDDGEVYEASIAQAASDYAAFKIPVGLQQGLKDVLFQIGAQSLLVKDAIDIQPADAVTVQFDQPSVYIYEKGNATIKVRKPDGTTYPDGTPIYINVVGPGVVTYNSDGSPNNSYAYGLLNGEVKLKIAAQTRIPPDTMDGANWPDWRSGHPNFEIRDVCLAKYYLGWRCDSRLGPTNPDDQPRMYVRDAYWVQGQREIPVYSGGLSYSQTLRIFDRAGIPVPNGTGVFIDGGYFTSFSSPPVTTGNEITVSIVSQGAKCWGAGPDGPGALEGIILRSIYSLYPGAGLRLRNMDGLDVYSMSIRYYLGPGCN